MNMQWGVLRKSQVGGKQGSKRDRKASWQVRRLFHNDLLPIEKGKPLAFIDDLTQL